MTQRYFLYIYFNGNKYHGWQKQINSITIQHVIQDSINKFFRQKIEVVGAGRTDTGVHANEMVAHIDLAKVNIDNFLYITDKLYINYINDIDISVFDINGRKILQTNNKTIDFSDFDYGIYLLHIKDIISNNYKTIKILKE